MICRACIQERDLKQSRNKAVKNVNIVRFVLLHYYMNYWQLFNEFIYRYTSNK